ncbi:hypothetical protein AALP_AA8G136000 [Arabis alpina]|uniref:Uncharacterized protein n=1 Tax=Arabis alpina TaxID=50452 RepID=A0A087G6V1_ARAAL|nr:hypothetical protein AALP_AA8G136000 [Arabis alpina]
MTKLLFLPYMLSEKKRQSQTGVADILSQASLEAFQRKPKQETSMERVSQSSITYSSRVRENNLKVQLHELSQGRNLAS